MDERSVSHQPRLLDSPVSTLPRTGYSSTRSFDSLKYQRRAHHAPPSPTRPHVRSRRGALVARRMDPSRGALLHTAARRGAEQALRRRDSPCTSHLERGEHDVSKCRFARQGTPYRPRRPERAYMDIWKNVTRTVPRSVSHLESDANVPGHAHELGLSRHAMSALAL